MRSFYIWLKNFQIKAVIGDPSFSDKNDTDTEYSMIIDDVSNMSFNDFCDVFGYNKDSIKALETYKACLKETETYYDMFDKEEREVLRELLEDY